MIYEYDWKLVKFLLFTYDHLFHSMHKSIVGCESNLSQFESFVLKRVYIYDFECKLE